MKNGNGGNGEKEWVRTILERFEDRFYRIDTALAELVKLARRNEERWQKNDERWEKNDGRWEKNDERWEKNDERWEKNDERWRSTHKLLVHMLEEIKHLKQRRS